LRDLLPYAVLAAAFTVLLLYAYPGYMSSDSASQLTQARAHAYSDGHPPVMAALRGLVEHVVRGPLGMLLLQTAALLIGLVLLLRRYFTLLAAALIASAILLFPPILTPMCVIWKDSQMAGWLVLGTALVLDPRRGLRWVGVAFLALGIAMRHNAPIAAFPLIVLLWPSTAKRWFVRAAIAVAIWIACIGVTLVAEHELVSTHDYTFSYSLGPADIVGILANTHHHYSDEELSRVLDGTGIVSTKAIQAHAKRIYTPVMWWWVTNGEDRMFGWPDTAEKRDAMSRAWKELVEREPGAYLHHRSRVFRIVLGYGLIFNPALFSPAYHTKMEVDPGAATDESTWEPQRTMQKAMDSVAWSPYFRPWIYLVLALIFLPVARRHKLALSLLASGVLYELTLVPFAPSAEFRYSHWMILCTVLATVLLIKARAASTSTR
jgi:hypothetical protein